MLLRSAIKVEIFYSSCVWTPAVALEMMVSDSRPISTYYWQVVAPANQIAWADHHATLHGRLKGRTDEFIAGQISIETASVKGWGRVAGMSLTEYSPGAIVIPTHQAIPSNQRRVSGWLRLECRSFILFARPMPQP